MITHIVVWKLKAAGLSGEKSDICLKIKNMLEELKSIIPEIIKIECGVNFNKSDAAYDISLYSQFDSTENLQIYQVHSAHRQVAEFISKVAEKRVVVDYQV